MCGLYKGLLVKLFCCNTSTPMHAQEAGLHLSELEGRRVGGQGGHLGILNINWAVQNICTIYVFPEKKLRGLSHVPVSDL